MQTVKEMIQQIQAITFDAYKSSGQAAALLKDQGGPPEAMAKALERTAAQMEQGTVELRALCESCLPELGDIIQWLKAQIGDDAGDERVLLSGSGSAVFAICASADEAVRLAAEAGKRGLWARATSFSPLRAVMIG